MALVTDIKNLSQTPALNGPDGTVDPPSSLDDQDRYLGSFIAMLRDGVGFTAGASVVALGFTPVRQGTGPGQLSNTVSIGWSAAGKLLCSVDTNPFGNKWPIDTTGDAGSVNGQVFAWSNPTNSPTYVWAANASGSAFLSAPAGMTVALATNANNAYACSGNAASASNAAAVNGISGWSYSNQNYNPPYLWATAGSGSSQFLVTPANLSVNYANSAGSTNYANSAGSAPANGGTANDSNNLQGHGAGYWIWNGNSAVQYIHNVGTTGMAADLGGGTQAYWNSTYSSDPRVKKDMRPVSVDSLASIVKLKFISYQLDATKMKGADERPHKVGVNADEAQAIEPDWIIDDRKAGPWKMLQDTEMLLSTMHAVQQLNAKVEKLSRLITGGS